MAKEVKSPASSGSVYVGCKLPHGLKLTLTEAREEKENVMGGGVRTFTIHRRSGEKGYKLHGVALEPGDRPRFTLTNGAAITKIPAAFWEKWLEQNQEASYVKSGLVFAHATEQGARDEAREKRKELSGFEPINTAVDSKGKPLDARMKGIRSVNKKDIDEDADEETEEA